MKKYLEGILIVLIFVSGLMFRMHAVNTIEYKMEYDTLNYHMTAKNLIENGIFGYEKNGTFAKEPNAYITPGYPLFLAGVYSAFGESEAEDIYAAKVVQAVLSAATIIFVYFIAKRLGGIVCAIIASGFMLLYPSFLVVAAYHLTETLYTFLFVFYLYLQIIAFDKEKKWLHTLTGFVFGLAVLVRPTIFPFFIVIYLYRMIFEKDRLALKSLLFFAIGLIAVMLPWWIRNVVTLGEFILLCTQAGNPLLGGAYPPQFAPSSYPQENQLAEGIRVIIDGFRYQTTEYLHWFTVGKFTKIFGQIYLIGLMPELENMVPIHFLVVALGCVAMLFAFAKKEIRIISLYTFMLIAVQLLFIPESRYAFSIMPLLMILASYFIVMVFLGIKRLFTKRNVKES